MTNRASDSFHDIIKYSKNIQDILYDSDLIRTSHNDELTHKESQQDLTHDDTPIMQLKLHYDSFSSTMTHLAHVTMWLMMTQIDSGWLTFISFNYK